MDVIKDKLLPHRMATIARLIGLPALLKLSELRGGGMLTVPKNATAKHWLVEHIGLDALQKLVAHCGGERISIDRCVLLKKAIKAQKIANEYNAGASCWQLAKKYEMTRRNVQLLRKWAAENLGITS